MKLIQKNLEQLRHLERRKYHPLQHKLHKKHNITRKTLFYIKEYGFHSNVIKVIVQESLGILLISGLLNALGGLAVESVKTTLISVLPLLIMLPALNAMLGASAAIVSSRYSTLLHEGRIHGHPFLNRELSNLFSQTLIISLIMVFITSLISVAVSHDHTFLIAYKILAIGVIDVLIMMIVIFIFTLSAGLYYFRKKEDPNNFLIPITTSIADFGNVVILSVLVVLFF
ncbi:magnesium transporter [Candidatus Pacearchaeota archaeon]|nr:magnesium transporter [Candidatus Pacearchaeota archaeon]